MNNRQKRLPTDLRHVLDESGLPWRLENGSRHCKLMINGRLATILPYGGRLDAFHGRADKNVVANVRRVIREQGR